MVCFNRLHHFTIFKRCFPQILPRPLLNTFSHLLQFTKLSSIYTSILHPWYLYVNLREWSVDWNYLAIYNDIFWVDDLSSKFKVNVVSLIWTISVIFDTWWSDLYLLNHRFGSSCFIFHCITKFPKCSSRCKSWFIINKTSSNFYIFPSYIWSFFWRGSLDLSCDGYTQILLEFI